MNKYDKAERRKSRKRYKLQTNNKNKLPRMSIFRSCKNISVQIIDDTVGKTLVSCSSLEKEMEKVKGYNKEGATLIGKTIGQRALEKKITEVVFDIGSYKYHGRIEALVKGALEVGLNRRGN